MRCIRNIPVAAIVLGAVLLVVGVASAALLVAPRRITFNLDPGAMPYPTAMLKVERPGAAQPTFFVGRGDWGDISLDLRTTSRHEARGVLTFPHLERNDPANLDEAVKAAWLSREGAVLVEIKLIDVTAVKPGSGSGDPRGEITISAALEGVRGSKPLTFTGAYLVEENGLAVRTNTARSGDVLTVSATATVTAADLGWGARAPANEPVTLTLFFQAAED
jgi:hypothetical protein